ncbi:MAG: hypothetical protein ABI036_21190 [Fibrobacteria bacterium]
MNSKRLFTVLSAAIVFGGCAKNGPPPFEADEFKADKEKVAKIYVKAEHPKALKKQPKQAVIPLFQVEFINESSASSSSYSLAKEGSTSTNLSYTLMGVDTAAFTALVDSLYTDFAADLKAQGYEVMPKEAMLATPQYAELKAKAEPTNPTQQPSRLEGKNQAMVVAPTGMAVVYLNSFNPKVSLKNMWSGMKGDLPEAPLARLVDSAKCVAVGVQMVVGFASLSDTHVKGSGNSSVNADFRFSIAPLHSEVMFAGDEAISKASNPSRWNFNAKDGTILRLQKPIFGSNGFATGTRDITSTGSKVAEGLGNALGVMAAMAGGGGAHTSKTRKYALDVDKDKYVGLARENLGYARGLLLTSRDMAVK